jgi:hypothetical protein
MPILSNLPPEITTNICKHLTHASLRCARFISRAFNHVGRQLLFQTIYLKFNLSSFDKLAAISEDEELRHLVEQLSYCGIELNDKSALHGFEEWLKTGAAYGLEYLRHSLGVPMPWEESWKEPFLKQYTSQELQKCHVHCCRYLFGQERLLKGDNEHKFLVTALRRFPRLSSVEYNLEPEVPLYRDETGTLGHEAMFLNAARQYIELQPVARSILAIPVTRYEQTDPRFWRLLESLQTIGSVKLKEVRAQSMGFCLFQGSVIPGLSNLTKEVQLLHLGFVLNECNGGDECFSRLNTFLAQFVRLKELRFSSGDYEPLKSGWIEFVQTSVFPDTLHWDHLATLALSGMGLSTVCLRDLLQKHSKTLRSLELSNMAIYETTPTISGLYKSLWILMIQTISESLSLAHMRFFGLFESHHTGCFERWRAPDKSEYGTVHPEISLIRRIELYITDNGQCPFSPREVVTVGSANPKIFWVWEEDHTWQYLSYLDCFFGPRCSTGGSCLHLQ